MKLSTLCYLIVDGKVLLAMKKRGFGIGKWNGPGGKANPGESIEEACKRETLEEVGVELLNLEPRGIIEFIFENKPENNHLCHIFVSTAYNLEPVETEEMLPKWYSLEEIPYSEMWEDDAIWLNGVLRGGTVNKRFYFNEAGKIIRYEEIG